MILCRFELRADPGTARSGILFDGRVYETDGENAIGIHEPGLVRLLTPIGTPPSVRLFDLERGGHGEPVLLYSYYNPGALVPTAGSLGVPVGEGDVEVELRVAVVVKDDGLQVEPSEAAGFVLGYSVLAVLYNAEAREDAQRNDWPKALAYDVGAFFGPSLVTPDDLADSRSADGGFQWTATVQVNGEDVCEVKDAPEASLEDLLSVASQRLPVRSGELLAFPALPVPPLSATPLGRPLLPGDRLSATIGPLGTLSGTLE